MSFQFTLRMTRVECLHEQMNEWGKDEMHLFAFGISRRGTLFATGYKSLGSYHEGDVNASGAFPLALFGGELHDEGLDVIFYFWLVEEDGGGVRKAAAALEAEFRASYLEKATALAQAQFPRECIPFTAFYKAVIPFESSIQKASTDGRNDELYVPRDLLLRYEGPSAIHFSKDLTSQNSKNLGDYLVTFNYSYHRIPVVMA